MLKPNSFYRFQQGWNAGFWPDNQIVSDLLNEIYTGLPAALSGLLVPGTNLYYLKSVVQQFVDQFNAYPYYGNFKVLLETAPDPPNYTYSIYIRDESLFVTDSNQQLIITGYFNNTTKLLIAPAGSITSFSPGSYLSGFGATLIREEEKVREALDVVYQNGSAIFPITYSYNPSTQVATSGLARGADWKLWGGSEPNRVPLPTIPFQNQRTFSLPVLTADDQYILSIFERIIQASLADTDYTNSVQNAIFSYTVPDDWTRTILHPSFTTYDRVQITYSDDSGRRKFILVGRLDGQWLWQRFVSDESGGAYNFLTAYTETMGLPYPILQAGRWLYNDNTYDLEFVEFNSGCYDSPEFYAMPAKPGDQWQFNIDKADANIIGQNSVLVGLFTEDGQLILKIGEAIDFEDICSEEKQAKATVTIPSKNGCYRLGLYNEPSTTCDLTFTYTITGEAITTYIEAIGALAETANPYVRFAIDVTSPVIAYVAPVSELTTVPDLVDWCNTNIPGMTVTLIDDESLTFTWQVNDLPCDAIYEMVNCQSDITGEVCISEGVLWESATETCLCGTSYYLYSLSNIINIDASDCYSTMLEFWSDSNSIAQGFEYFDGWKQRVRLGINGGGEKPIIEENLYRQSNGVHKRPQNKQDLSLDLHTDFLDLPTQLALVDATRHPYLVWNQKNIFVNGDIEVATIQDFSTQSSFETLAQVKFSALLQGFQPSNSSCLTC